VPAFFLPPLLRVTLHILGPTCLRLCAGRPPADQGVDVAHREVYGIACRNLRWLRLHLPANAARPVGSNQRIEDDLVQRCRATGKQRRPPARVDRSFHYRHPGVTLCALAHGAFHGDEIFSAEYGFARTNDTVMNITLSLAPLISLIAGVLILVMPRALNYIVAAYLIVVGLLGLFGGVHLR